MAELNANKGTADDDTGHERVIGLILLKLMCMSENERIQSGYKGCLVWSSYLVQSQSMQASIADVSHSVLVELGFLHLSQGSLICRGSTCVSQKPTVICSMYVLTCDVRAVPCRVQWTASTK